MGRKATESERDVTRKLERYWLLTSSIAGICGSPVVAISKGPRRARVRLQHKRRWNGKWLEAGSVVSVPSWALSKMLGFDMVSVGNGVFVRADSKRGRAAIERCLP